MTLSRFKSRGLPELMRRFPNIRKQIDERLKLHKPLRVLEVGCGYGMALLDLGLAYPGQLDLHGINKAPHDGGLDSIQEIARQLLRHSEEQIAAMQHPEFHYFDVCAPWPLEDNSYDLIFSQHAFLHFTDKVLALEEIHRVLRPDGIALLDLHIRQGGKVLRNSIIVIDGDREVPFWEYAQHHTNLSTHSLPDRSLKGRLRRMIYRLTGNKELLAKQRAHLEMKKAAHLDFKLKFSAHRPHAQFYPGRKGKQSVYRLRETLAKAAETTAPLIALIAAGW